MSKKPSADDTYSEEETERRVEATLRAAFNTPRPVNMFPVSGLSQNAQKPAKKKAAKPPST